MSFSDSRLGPKNELILLRKRFIQLDTYLFHMESRPVLRAHVPYGAGISRDGQTVYIDARLDLHLNSVDLSPALSAHEQVEFGLRQFAKIGEDYAADPRGHRLANRAEYDKLSELFPNLDADEAWNMYNKHLEPQIRAIENLPFENIPYNLATHQGSPK